MNKFEHVDGNKQCSCCGEWKEATLEFFFKDVSRWDNLTHRCKECRKGARRKWFRKLPRKSKDELARQVKDARDKRRKEVLEHYSNGKMVCACCEESHVEFLTIDHVDGGGSKHRKKVGYSGSPFYYWLIKNDFPEGYQVLCHNCNFAKSNVVGGCPHQKERRPQ